MEIVFSVDVSVVFNINCITMLLFFIDAHCTCGPWGPSPLRMETFMQVCSWILFQGDMQKMSFPICILDTLIHLKFRIFHIYTKKWKDDTWLKSTGSSAHWYVSQSEIISALWAALPWHNVYVTPICRQMHDTPGWPRQLQRDDSQNTERKTSCQ